MCSALSKTDDVLSDHPNQIQNKPLMASGARDRGLLTHPTSPSGMPQPKGVEHKVSIEPAIRRESSGSGGIIPLSPSHPGPMSQKAGLTQKFVWRPRGQS